MAANGRFLNQICFFSLFSEIVWLSLTNQKYYRKLSALSWTVFCFCYLFIYLFSIYLFSIYLFIFIFLNVFDSFYKDGRFMRYGRKIPKTNELLKQSSRRRCQFCQGGNNIQAKRRKQEGEKPVVRPILLMHALQMIEGRQEQYHINSWPSAIVAWLKI